MVATFKPELWLHGVRLDRTQGQHRPIEHKLCSVKLFGIKAKLYF